MTYEGDHFYHKYSSVEGSKLNGQKSHRLISTKWLERRESGDNIFYPFMVLIKI